jgi:hypothetical protein
LDHKNEKHDMAIHFLSQPEILVQVCKSFELCCSTNHQYFGGVTVNLFPSNAIDIVVKTERPITKGYDQYKQTVGLLMVL